METELISVEEAAKILDITGTHLRKLIKEGSLPYINLAHGKIRKSIRIDRKVLEEFIKNGGIKV